MLDLSSNETEVIIDALQSWLEEPGDSSVKTSIMGSMIVPDEEKSKQLFNKVMNESTTETQKRRQRVEDLRHRVASNALHTADVTDLVTALNSWVYQPSRANSSMDMLMAVLVKRKPDRNNIEQINRQCEERDEIATMIKAKLYLWRAR